MLACKVPWALQPMPGLPTTNLSSIIAWLSSTDPGSRPGCDIWHWDTNTHCWPCGLFLNAYEVCERFGLHCSSAEETGWYYTNRPSPICTHVHRGAALARGARHLTWSHGGVRNSYRTSPWTASASVIASTWTAAAPAALDRLDRIETLDTRR